MRCVAGKSRDARRCLCGVLQIFVGVKVFFCVHGDVISLKVKEKFRVRNKNMLILVD